MKPRVFTMGDCHGAHKAVKQCLERSKFNYDKDTLIMLGDIVDGWPETPECVDEFLKIKNFIGICGNHDMWARDWLKMGARPLNWTQQGGQATIDAYIRTGQMLDHVDFFNKLHNYYIDDENRLFVHGGLLKNVPLREHTLGDLAWDRSLFSRAMSSKLFKGDDRFKEIFIGHTTTEKFSLEPIHRGNVWMLDQGAGWGGVLTLMDVNTKEIFQSDIVKELYPNVKGR